MPRALRFAITTSLLALSLAIACASDTPEGTGVAGPDPGWEEEVAEWKAKRDEGLRRDGGWLSLVGLLWLEEGENHFGSDAGNDLVFPAGAPGRMGTLVREGRSVRLQVDSGVEILSGGEPVEERLLTSDAGGEPTILEHGSLSFYVIERGDRVGVRLKDSQSDLLRTFEGMEYFPLAPAWRLEARFETYDEPRPIQVPNIIGDSFEMEAHGVVVFRVNGREYRLEPTGEPEGELFFVFGDETNGDTTYGGGRFLSAGPPAADGSLILDFNRAYNPPCVFTPYATCPLPRPEDRLPLAVEAGEKMFGGAH